MTPRERFLIELAVNIGLLSALRALPRKTPPVPPTEQRGRTEPPKPSIIGRKP